MSEVQEKRKSKRIGINVKIKLQKVSNNLIAFGLKEEEFEVNIVNISKDGMAFRTKERLALNSFLGILISSPLIAKEIVPVSSETTIVRESVISLIPKAARCLAP